MSTGQIPFQCVLLIVAKLAGLFTFLEVPVRCCEDLLNYFQME